LQNGDNFKRAGRRIYSIKPDLVRLIWLNGNE
jgi:hypothetical protein